MRRTLSRLLFGLGALMLLSAVVSVVYARVKPAQGLEDLGWFVFGLLLVATAGIPIALGLLVAPAATRRTIVLAGLGCVLAGVAGVAFVTTGTPPLVALGVVSLALGVAGLGRGVRLWRAPVRHL